MVTEADSQSIDAKSKLKGMTSQMGTSKQFTTCHPVVQEKTTLWFLESSDYRTIYIVEN
jgi:hypothetical protein